MSIEVIFIIVLILLSACFATALWSEKELHNATKRCLELSSKQIKELGEKLESLQNELKTYKDMERVIKVEKVVMQPREIECKFMLHERFVDDTELFKKVITSEVARYMAEELNKDPYLCKIYHERNIPGQESIKVRFRLLPYPEGVVWDDILKEEK